MHGSRPLTALLRHPDFRQGVRDMLPPSLGLAAWGLVTGVAMVKSGLTLWQALGMSLLVFAGSAQLASLPLLAAGAPWWVILGTAFCVNLRFVIFSAQWRGYWGHLPRWQRLLMAYWATDLAYVRYVQRYPSGQPAPGQVPYFIGGAVVMAVCWHVLSIIGIVLADRVPAHWGLGFAGTLALLGMCYSLLTERVLWAVAAVAGLVSIATYHLPFKLNIICAIVVAGALGLWLERRRGARGG